MFALLDWYLAARWRGATAPETDRLASDRLKGFFGSTRPVDAGIAAQQLYVDHRRSQRVKDSTIQRELSVLSAALTLAEKHEKIERAPARLTLKQPPAKERWLTRKEAARILRHFRAEKRAKHLLLFTRLGLATGARSSAILELTWDRVDLERGLVWFPLPGQRSITKGRAVVPLEPPMLRALRAARRRSNHSHVITWAGEPCARIVRAFRRHMKTLDLPDVTPHTLRHTFATWAAQKGVPLFLVGRALGQSVIATTERYAKHNPETLREVTRAARRK